MDERASAGTLALTPADRALGRADVAAALAGHQLLTDRKPKPQRATKDHSATLARRLDRLARQALPAELRKLQREPGEIWLLAHDPDRAEAIDDNHRGRGMAPFDAGDPDDVARVARNDAMRARLRKTAAGNARRLGADVDAGEIEVAGTSMASAPADLLIEAQQTLLAMQAAGLIDDQWHRAVARPATCGDASDDAEALPVAVAAELAGCSGRSVQTHMQGAADAEHAGQLVLPCVPCVHEVYKARPRGGEVTP
jgi:hypothetical protein